MTVAVIVAGLLLVVIGVVLAVVRATARATMVAAEKRLAASLGGLRPARLEPAVCLGLDDPALPPIEGQGQLALTARELLFSLATPARLLRLRRDRLTGARVEGTLLLVDYLGDGERACQVRWRVSDAAAWVRDLGAAGST